VIPVFWFLMGNEGFYVFEGSIGLLLKRVIVMAWGGLLCDIDSAFHAYS
jgi:hypothetical protein